MAAPGIPQNFFVQTGNYQNYVSVDLTATATSYKIQRSLDGVTYAALATSSTPAYLDTAVSVGVEYFYRVAASNVDGDSAYTTPASVVTTPTAEMSLGQLRLAAQQRADRVGSNFVTLPEWNSYINQAMYALYDLLIATYEDYFMAPRARITTVANQFRYTLPDGITTFKDQSNVNFIAAPIYKLLGVDLSANLAANAFVTLKKYNVVDRNNFAYQGSNSTPYGVVNAQYRMMGNAIELIPTPAPGQTLQLLYIPRLPQLLQDKDLTTIGYSGWLEYVILRAAIMALTKEESDVSSLAAQLIDVKARIEESAVNRDAGMPDTISDSRGSGGWNFPGGF